MYNAVPLLPSFSMLFLSLSLSRCVTILTSFNILSHLFSFTHYHTRCSMCRCIRAILFALFNLKLILMKVNSVDYIFVRHKNKIHKSNEKQLNTHTHTIHIHTHTLIKYLQQQINRIENGNDQIEHTKKNQKCGVAYCHRNRNNIADSMK